MKNHKYLNMHQDLLGLCKDYNISLIPGKAAYVESLRGELLKCKKNFFLLPDDFEMLSNVIDDILPAELYQIKRNGESETGRELTIERKDIFAGSIPSVIKKPKADFFPVFALKELQAEDEDYTVVMNKQKKKIPQTLFDKTEEFAYFDYCVVLPIERTSFFLSLYGATVTAADKVVEYSIFYEDFDCKAYIEEALQRGLLTDDVRKKDSAFSKWLKEEKRPVLKAYMEYEEELLATELPD